MLFSQISDLIKKKIIRHYQMSPVLGLLGRNKNESRSVFLPAQAELLLKAC